MIGSRSVGMPFGIVAGQAWECEPQIDRSRLPARQDRRAVRRRHDGRRGGRRRGCRAVARCSASARRGLSGRRRHPRRGRASRRDRQAGRPRRRAGAPERGRSSSVSRARCARLEQLVGEAVASIPDCPGCGCCACLIALEAERLAAQEACAVARPDAPKPGCRPAMPGCGAPLSRHRLDRSLRAARDRLLAQSRGSSAGPPASR